MVVGQAAIGAVKAGTHEAVEAGEGVNEVSKVVRPHQLGSLDCSQTLNVLHNLPGCSDAGSIVVYWNGLAAGVGQGSGGIVGGSDLGGDLLDQRFRE